MYVSVWIFLKLQFTGNRWERCVKSRLFMWVFESSWSCSLLATGECLNLPEAAVYWQQVSVWTFLKLQFTGNRWVFESSWSCSLLATGEKDVLILVYLCECLNLFFFFYFFFLMSSLIQYIHRFIYIYLFKSKTLMCSSCDWIAMTMMDSYSKGFLLH